MNSITLSDLEGQGERSPSRLMYGMDSISALALAAQNRMTCSPDRPGSALGACRALAARHIPSPDAATAQRRWHDDDWNTTPTGELSRRT
jgi:hypothetical protein